MRMAVPISSSATIRLPNALLQNASADTGPAFADVAVAVGVAVGSSGRPQACMGISCADVDGNGWLDLLVTNFQNQPNSLYLNNGGLFEEAGAIGSIWRMPAAVC